MTPVLLLTTLCALFMSVTAPLHAQPLANHAFSVDEPAEAVADIAVTCSRCDWSVAGREAAVLTLSLDGDYSQHLVLAHGGTPSHYRVLLGALAPGSHRLIVASDGRLSAPGAGDVSIDAISIESYAESTPQFPWLSRAPFLRARPDSVEHFSDVPLLAYVETDVAGEAAGPYRFQYTVVFSHEDGGTPADRLMATWGRTTDIEFVYGVQANAAGRGVIQADGHRWVEFAGPHIGSHPVLWVATMNNMVADSGPASAIRFAPAPTLVDLTGVSREAVMDANPWTYAVTAGELMREGRVEPSAAAGSGSIVAPNRFAVVEVCADVTGAALALEVGVRVGGAVEWHSTDRGLPQFRIVRSGCFRAAAPLPQGTSPADIAGVRVRARAVPGDAGSPVGRDARVTVTRVNTLFMLDERFKPVGAGLRWGGELTVVLDDSPSVIPLSRQ